MDGGASAAFWLKFFQEAGIPSSDAATYANIFHGNRIRVNMLLDLNKEYLKDMGVNVLGDIIAILKHSKLYHEKVVRDKVLANDEREVSIVKGIKPIKEHMSESPKAQAISVNKPVASQVIKPSPPKKSRMTVQSETSPQEHDDIDEHNSALEVKRKVVAPKTSPVVKLDASSLSVGSAKTTKKSSVFQRLGESNVTSTTPEIPEPTQSATGKSSVFRRLGGIASEKTEADSAPVRTILQPVKKKTPVVAPKPTPTSPVVVIKPPLLRMDVEAATNKQTARARLGVESQQKAVAKVAPKNPPTKTISSRLSLPARQTASTGVKHRIGTVKSNVVVPGALRSSSAVAKTSSVFSRLTITKKRI